MKRNATVARWLAPAFGLVLSAAVSPAGGETGKTVELKEHLGRAWQQELVTFPVSFPPEACRADSGVSKEPRTNRFLRQG